MSKTTKAIIILSAIIVLAGCASSRVHFEAPIGAHLYLEQYGTQIVEKEYTLPVTIDLPQSDSPTTFLTNVGGRPIRMTLRDGTKLRGFLYVYKLSMDQLERVADVTFRLTAAQIAKLKNGDAVTVIGYSALKRPVYKINLGLDR